MSEPTKKPRESVSIHLRVRRETADWLEGQINDDQPSAPAVARRIINREKRRKTRKKPES